MLEIVILVIVLVVLVALAAWAIYRLRQRVWRVGALRRQPVGQARRHDRREG